MGFYCERELEIEHNCNILTPLLWPSALCLSRSPGLLNRRPRAHSAGRWLSLLHLISNFSGPQTPSGFPRAPSAGCGFTYHISSISVSNFTATQLAWLLSYISFQRPLDRPLDLWNRMFDRNQAEITVMKFTSHSFLVHQSMSVPWEFFSSSNFISQFPPTRFPLITAIRMCHLLLVHHLGMAFLAGSKSQNITLHRPLISSSSSHLTNLLEIIPSVTIKSSITITLMFHRFYVP